MVKYGRKAVDLIQRSFFRPGSLNLPATEQRNIGVAGLSQCSGTTVIASSLALFFAESGKSVTFTECGEPSGHRGLLYDAVSMEQRFVGRRFTDFYGELRKGGTVRHRRNPEMGVNWALITPSDVRAGLITEAAERSHLVSAAEGDICVFDLDLAGNWADQLPAMDELYVVTDPMPSRLLAGTERFKMLKRLELRGQIPVRWLVNRNNEGVSRRQVRNFLKSTEVYWLPDIPQRCFYSDEYHSRFHWENPEIRNAFLPVFTKLSHL